MRQSVRPGVGVLGLVALLCASCGSPGKLVLECPSPDGQHLATLFLIPGPSRGRLVARLTLRRVREWWQADVALLDLVGGYDLRVTWLAARHLLVEFPEDARAARAEPVAWVGERFEVTYAQVPGNKGLLLLGGSRCRRAPPAP